MAIVVVGIVFYFLLQIIAFMFSDDIEEMKARDEIKKNEIREKVRKEYEDKNNL